MENGEFAYSADLKEELVTSLTTFVRLYGQHSHQLQTTSKYFTLTAAQILKGSQVLVSVIGRVLGELFGGISGGLLGAIGAVTCSSLDDINDETVCVGIVSSVLGGVVGGALGGGVGSVVCVATEPTGNPVHSILRDVAWFNIGFATGGAIGGIFGGTIGATGGAIGGALGALCSSRFVVSLVGAVIGSYYRTKDSKEQKKFSEKTPTHDTDIIICVERDFRGAIKPLVEELKNIKRICDKMAPSDIVHSVARQTTKTLASVTTMEETLSDPQRVTDVLHFVSSVEEAARQSEKINEELETTRAELETCLVSLRKQNSNLK